MTSIKGFIAEDSDKYERPLSCGSSQPVNSPAGDMGYSDTDSHTTLPSRSPGRLPLHARPGTRGRRTSGGRRVGAAQRCQGRAVQLLFSSQQRTLPSLHALVLPLLQAVEVDEDAFLSMRDDCMRAAQRERATEDKMKQCVSTPGLGSVWHGNILLCKLGASELHVSSCDPAAC